MNIRSVRKKSLSILLTLAILVGAIPNSSAVFANGDNHTSGEITTDTQLDEEIIAQEEEAVVAASDEVVVEPFTDEIITQEIDASATSNEVIAFTSLDEEIAKQAVFARTAESTNYAAGTAQVSGVQRKVRTMRQARHR